MLGRRFPDDALIEDEWVVTTVRPQWRVILVPVFFTVAFALLVAWIWFTMSDNFWGRALFALVVLGGLAPWGWYALPRMATWYRTRYAFTNRRVLVRRGVFNARQVDIQFVSVNDAIIERHGLDAIFGSGTLILGRGPDHSLPNIPDVNKMKKLAMQLVALSHEMGADMTWLEQNFRRFRNRAPGTGPAQLPRPGQPSADRPAAVPPASPENQAG